MKNDTVHICVCLEFCVEYSPCVSWMNDDILFAYLPICWSRRDRKMILFTYSHKSITSKPFCPKPAVSCVIHCVYSNTSLLILDNYSNGYHFIIMFIFSKLLANTIATNSIRRIRVKPWMWREWRDDSVSTDESDSLSYEWPSIQHLENKSISYFSFSINSNDNSTFLSVDTQILLFKCKFATSKWMTKMCERKINDC